MPEHLAELTWKANGVPVSSRFDDPYYSLEDGLAETNFVFLAGNDLPARFVDGFRIAELGFGTGLSFLTTLLAWQESGVAGQFRFTSFEAFPLEAAQLGKALARFPQIEALSQELVSIWQPGGGQMQFANGGCLDVIIGDARETLPKWEGTADAWFLDGFSPAKNPELWEQDLLQAVGTHTRVGGTMATYTAAGFVRRGLENAGFSVQRVSGFGRKRHMTRGVKTHVIRP